MVVGFTTTCAISAYPAKVKGFVSPVTNVIEGETFEGIDCLNNVNFVIGTVSPLLYDLGSPYLVQTIFFFSYKNIIQKQLIANNLKIWHGSKFENNYIYMITH
jgi:hypothetical protein